jgi:hypothetical protein
MDLLLSSGTRNFAGNMQASENKHAPVLEAEHSFQPSRVGIVYAAFSGLVQSIIQQETGEDQRTKTAPVPGRKAPVP